MSETVVFADTSIQIARTLREPEMRRRIEQWVRRYKFTVTGTIALLEFRNRVLRDAYYLLSKLNQFKSYQRTLHHVFNVLPRQLHRKQRVSVMILHSLLPAASDQELTERARLYCRTLLAYGEEAFFQRVDSFGPGIGCYWSQMRVVEKRRYERYEFPDRYCTKSGGRCGIVPALTARKNLCAQVSGLLDSLGGSRETAELVKAAEFLRLLLHDAPADQIAREEPCLKVGDLLLALESASIEDFYTMNYAESQAYCDVLNQNLTVRPNDPAQDERHYKVDARPWPSP